MPRYIVITASDNSYNIVVHYQVVNLSPQLLHVNIAFASDLQVGIILTWTQISFATYTENKYQVKEGKRYVPLTLHCHSVDSSASLLYN